MDQLQQVALGSVWAGYKCWNLKLPTIETIVGEQAAKLTADGMLSAYKRLDIAQKKQIDAAGARAFFLLVTVFLGAAFSCNGSGLA